MTKNPKPLLLLSLVLLLFLSLFSGMTRGTSSAQVTLLSNGSFSIKVNLAPILSTGVYENYPNSFTANAHFDTNVLYNGATTVRIDPSDPNGANPQREADALNGAMIHVNPGDHVVFSCWIRTTSSQNPVNNNNPSGGGARLGIDFNNGISIVAFAVVNGVAKTDQTPITGNPASSGSFIYWNTPTWTLQTVDCVVPSGLGITGFVAWMQVLGGTDTGLAWFADSVIYVN